MRKDRGNPLALSSEQPCQGQTGCRRELERLHAGLEGERDQTERASGRLRAELRRLREEAEEEHQRALKDLAAKEGRQKERYSDRQRCLPAKAARVNESGRHREARWTGKGSAHLFRGHTNAKLEQLLLLLYEKINSEQPVFKLRRREQLELKKAILICNLLKAHGRVLQEKHRADYPACIFKQRSRKQEDDDDHHLCHPDPFIAYSRALLQRSHSALHSVQEKPKQDQQEGPLGSALPAADLHSTTAAWDTCQTGSLKICHPSSITHAGWDEQPPCCTKFFKSKETTPSKCTYRNMEVSYKPTFTLQTHSQK